MALLAVTKLEVQANTKEMGLLQQAIEPALRTAKQRNDEIRMKLNGINSRPSSGDATTSANEVFQSVSMMGMNTFTSTKLLLQALQHCLQLFKM